MEHTVEKLSGNKVKISFKAPAADFAQAIDAAYRKTRGQISVPGFRKGKAPRKLIERMYGTGVFYEDALEALFPDAYMTAVKENELQPVGRPELDVQEMEEGKDLLFSCEVYVYPEVKLGEYKGVEVAREHRAVSEDEVDARLEQERQRVARSVDVTDRALENGDKAELDYMGTVDGVAFEGGTAEHQSLVIGSNSFIPGFEAQMVGMQIGEERDLNVTFPEEYHSKDLQGKDAVFHVKLHAITREELPELDDEFAAEVSDFDTLAEYRADLAAKLQKSADEQADSAAHVALLNTVVENAEVDVPDPMVQDKLDEMMQQMSWRMNQMGITMDKYLELIGQSEAQLRSSYRAEALNNVKTDVVVDEIIKVEGIEADDSEVDKELESYASSINQTIDQLKASFGPEQLDYFKHRARISKALDMLWDNAKVTDKQPEEKEAAEGENA